MTAKIFLTGEIQIGKSTVITKTLSQLQIIPEGFRTYFGPDRESPDRLLYMSSAAGLKAYSEANAVARFFRDKPPLVLTEQFNTFGADLVRSARNNAKIILMDECGNFERDALLFQKEILHTLNGNIPVLGVIKLASGGWADLIRTHPKVTIFTVTTQNRNTLPYILSKSLRLSI